jgi:DNA-binding MarR family transcriptional regulator
MAKTKTRVAIHRERFLDGYLPYLMAHASHRISAQFHRHIATQGIRPSSWRLLGTLADTGGLTVGELADEMMLQQPTVTKIVFRLEDEGLVARRSSPKDRRQVIIDLTARGRLLFAALEKKARQHQAEVLSAYSAAEKALLFDVLRELLRRTSASEWEKPRLVAQQRERPR